MSHPATRDSKTNEQKRYKKYLMRSFLPVLAIKVKTNEVRKLNTMSKRI
jgi:hypothetical protein